MSTVSGSATAVPQSRPGLLRFALTADAVVTGVNGLAYLVAAGPLEELLGLDAALLRGVGAFLVAFAVLVALVARRPTRGTVAVVVAANAIWAADSLIVALFGWGDPTTVGTVWIVLQALTVGAFAVLQGVGRRELSR